MSGRSAKTTEATPTVRFTDLAHHLEEQIRGITNPAAVNRYRQAMQAGEAFPPLQVAEVAGALILVDGFHRRDAAEALGWDSFPAIIRPCDSLKIARWWGYVANLRHGQPLKSKLLRPALGALIDAGLHRSDGGRLMSYRELAKELPGVSHSTIRRWIEQDYSALFQEMGGGETEAPGGLPDGSQPLSPEESVLAEALARIAEAGALLRALTAGTRWRAANDVEALRRELTWDRLGRRAEMQEDDPF